MILVLFLAGCASPQFGSAFPDPTETVKRVEAHPEGVTGTFSLESRSFRLGEGPEAGGIYFFSTRDFRDPNCLTVYITAAAARAFLAQGQELPFALSGRRMEVTGRARRVKQKKSETALETEILYDRTQIDVTAPAQIKIAPAGKNQ